MADPVKKRESSRRIKSAETAINQLASERAAETFDISAADALLHLSIPGRSSEADDHALIEGLRKLRMDDPKNTGGLTFDVRPFLKTCKPSAGLDRWMNDLAKNATDDPGRDLLGAIMSYIAQVGQHLPQHTKIDLLFRAIDADNSGEIVHEELLQLVMQLLKYTPLRLNHTQYSLLTKVLFESIDTDGSGVIDKEEFEYLINAHPKLLGEVLQPRKAPLRPNNVKKKPSCLDRIKGRYSGAIKFWREMYLDEPTAIWWFAIYVIANLVFFSWKFNVYSKGPPFAVMGYCVSSARGAAQAILFNSALVLWPVCRQTLTFIRDIRGMTSLIPFDLSLEFHKLCACVLFFFASIHTLAHLCDFARLTSEPDPEKIRAIFGTTFGPAIIPTWFQAFSSLPGVTGLIMVGVFLTAFPLAMQKVRLKSFRLFWYAHHLLFIFLIALMAHGWSQLLERAQAVYWAGPPLFFYLCERIPRVFRKGKCASIIEAQALKNVVALKYEKPKGVKMMPGQYVFLNSPEISRNEWHPFSLTCADGDDFLSCHIRTVGPWTRELHRRVDIANKECEYLDEEDSSVKHSARDYYPQLFMHGPMGAPCQRANEFDINILIGAGIGVTPMISVMRGLLANFHKPVVAAGPPAKGKRKKAGGSGPIRTYFHWTSRSQDDFNMFAEVLEALSAQGGNRVEIHNHLTTVKSDPVMFNYARELVHKQEGVDLVSGLKTTFVTHLGRPNWVKEFTKVKEFVLEDRAFARHRATMRPVSLGCFFCGPHVMQRGLRDAAAANECPELDWNLLFEKF